MIQSIGPITSLFEPKETEQAGQAGGFGDIFKMAIDAVKETDAEKTQMQYLMATGQLDNPAELSLAASKYELSVNLLVQLRNRALDAYNELIRITL
ncbi:MAG: flagellar hook-basal body complex protein FliE [Acutalibacter sp.]|nr:flagellar hook-basal body complex protein FliE [Acutalibacter sp.]